MVRGLNILLLLLGSQACIATLLFAPGFVGSSETNQKRLPFRIDFLMHYIASLSLDWVLQNS